MNEELDDILARPPGSLLRWGITVLFGIGLLVLAGTWFIHYPEVVRGTVIVATDQSPMPTSKLATGSLSDAHFTTEAIFGIAHISRLKVGQQVLIRLDAFPFREYGVWKGVVQELKPATNPNQCRAVILLSNKLRLAQLLQKLPFRPKLSGNAELITNDLRLIERLAYGLLNP